jgi:glycosyltransferase involved in cell wall biosynthesis
MLSFIVIGYNEGWKLTKCIQSIVNTVEYNQIKKYEIIYVDSNSTDNSIERVKEFGIVHILKLSGDLNAAIARNIGAKEAKGKVYFFIDGDMEIIPDFLRIVYSDDGKLIDNFVSGQWINYYYNHLDELIQKDKYKSKKNDKIEKTTGGLFLINENVWKLIGGMNIKFKNAEDHDLGLRLASKGIYLLRKKEIAAIHHTVSYLDKKRMWQDLLNFSHLYSRSLLYRTHILNTHIYNKMIRNDYTLMILMICLISLFFSIEFTKFIFIFYFLVIIFRGKFRIRNLFYYFLRDVSSLVGFFIFYPKKLSFSAHKLQP